MIKHLSKRRKDELNLILGSVLEEITEDFEANFEEDKKEQFELLQTNILNIVNVINKGYNLNAEQYILSSAIIHNGLQNLQKNFQVFEKEQQSEERDEIIKEIFEETYMYENLLLDLVGIIKLFQEEKNESEE